MSRSRGRERKLSLTNNSVAPYGLGVWVLNELGRPVVSHRGGNIGFQSSLVYFSDRDMARIPPRPVSMLMGSPSPSRAALATP